MSAMSRRDNGTFTSWRKMLERCGNPNEIGYARYGGRGIKVCPAWRASFDAFLADMGERPQGMTLDRWPDTNGNYEPVNCRWATRQEQARNTRTNTVVEINGESRCLTEWIEVLGFNEATVWTRIKRGMTPEKALSHKLLPRPKNKTAAKITKEQAADIKSLLASGAKQSVVAKLFGVDPSSISNIHRGVTWA